jgi:hypothetical protein
MAPSGLTTLLPLSQKPAQCEYVDVIKKLKAFFLQKTFFYKKYSTPEYGPIKGSEIE